ncbi:hypothetical protein V8Z74_05265 [Comamonas sp. w2-DMI]|uniref:hypothetical protein n=1 Tax=Comamonas sp. w2-DMI TaxID=3126391 RepID=UPI0032E5077C
MGRIHATFVGGPLGGRLLEVENLSAYRAFDQQTGEEVVYQRHTAVVPASAGKDIAIYVIMGQTDSEVLSHMLTGVIRPRQT